MLALMVIVAGAEESSRDHSTTNELCPKALMPNTPFQAPQGKQGCCLVDKALGGMELISDLFRCKSFATGKKADTLITQWFGTGLPCFMSAPVSIRTDLKMCCNIADFEKCATALGDVAQTVVAMTAQFDKCAADPTRAVMTSKPSTQRRVRQPIPRRLIQHNTSASKRTAASTTRSCDTGDWQQRPPLRTWQPQS